MYEGETDGEVQSEQQQVAAEDSLNLENQEDETNLKKKIALYYHPLFQQTLS